MDEKSEKTCPSCGEPVKDTWKICPVCETPLKAAACPQCGMPVKENWKRCPECGARIAAKDNGETAQPPLVETIVEPVTGMALIWVPGGQFVMGDTFGEGIENEQPVHEVIVDGFFMGKFPVTQLQWKAVMSENPAEFKGDNHPVEQVSWADAHRFLHHVNEAAEGGRYALPTEAEWEYAARSGGKEQLYAGGNEAEPVAWFEDNSGGRPHPVGEKKPNDLGLYDMSGNVWEWCADFFHPDAYERHDKSNPLMEEKSEERVLRGGSWNLDAWSARCARRFGYPADLFGPGVGFRIVFRN